MTDKKDGELTAMRLFSRDCLTGVYSFLHDRQSGEGDVNGVGVAGRGENLCFPDGKLSEDDGTPVVADRNQRSERCGMCGTPSNDGDVSPHTFDVDEMESNGQFEIRTDASAEGPAAHDQAVFAFDSFPTIFSLCVESGASQQVAQADRLDLGGSSLGAGVNSNLDLRHRELDTSMEKAMKGDGDGAISLADSPVTGDGQSVESIVRSSSRACRPGLFVKDVRFTLLDGSAVVGKGLFSTEDLRAGTFVGLYAGKKYTDEEANAAPPQVRIMIYTHDTSYIGASLAVAGSWKVKRLLEEYSIQTDAHVCICPETVDGEKPDPARYPLCYANEPRRGDRATCQMIPVEFTYQQLLDDVLDVRPEMRGGYWNGMALFVSDFCRSGQELTWHYGPLYRRVNYEPGLMSIVPSEIDLRSRSHRQKCSVGKHYYPGGACQRVENVLGRIPLEAVYFTGSRPYDHTTTCPRREAEHPLGGPSRFGDAESNSSARREPDHNYS